MDSTRLEIEKDGIFISLKLGKEIDIKYNNVINKIGKVDTREISHSNTFSIPYIHHNIEALGLNVFNTTDLAIGLNQKYPAKYYKEGTLLQEGFVVINNTEGSIKLNFIDEALSLTEKWGSTSYKELLRNRILPIPSEYKTAISEMEDYVVNKTIVLPHLTNVSGESVPIALFPNNLNCIGDEFQVYKTANDELRLDDSFNPYQSRPIFNAYSFLNIICKSYGFTPIFDETINWDTIKDTYMVSEGLNKSGKDSGGIVGTNHGIIGSSNPFYTTHTAGTPNYTWFTAFNFDILTGLIPNNLSPIPTFIINGDTVGLFHNSRTIFVPDISAGNVGTLRFKADLSESIGGGVAVFALFEVGTSTGGVENLLLTLTVNDSTTSTIDVTVDKSQLDTADPSVGALIGIYVVVGGFLSLPSTGAPTSSALLNMQVEETFLPVGVISYDEFGQFLANPIDLTYAASSDSISKIVNGIMHKEGMLMNIDSVNKEVEFFSYAKYKNNRELGLYNDWTNYLQEYINPKFNTNYGNDYAIINQIGLSSPYPGNTNKISLGNQTSNSKYKDFTENYLNDFSDVTGVDEILNTISPYTEFEVDGKSLVEFGGNISTLIQRRYDQDPLSTQGNILNLPSIVNVNYSTVPQGISDWYELIDNSVRAKPSFILPLDVVKNLDLRLPIYVGQLGGFYILEELEGYQNSSTIVRAKLIKMTEQEKRVAPPLTITIASANTNSYSFNSSVVASGGVIEYNFFRDGVEEFAWQTSTTGFRSDSSGVSSVWKVRTRDSSGTVSEFSDNFTISTQCLAPVLSSTSSNSTSVTFSIASVVGAVSYKIQYKVSGTTEWLDETESATVGVNTISLAGSTTYNIRVAAININPDIGEFSGRVGVYTQISLTTT